MTEYKERKITTPTYFLILIGVFFNPFGFGGGVSPNLGLAEIPMLAKRSSSTCGFLRELLEDAAWGELPEEDKLPLPRLPKPRLPFPTLPLAGVKGVMGRVEDPVAFSSRESETRFGVGVPSRGRFGCSSSYSSSSSSSSPFSSLFSSL
jgi:hypothetical protein